MRETGGFLKGWPRFIPVCHGLFDPAGGTVEAQSVVLTAPPVLCCMGDCFGIPMNVCFFFYISSVVLFLSPILSLAPSSLAFSPSFSYRSLWLHIHLFLSFVVLIFCLFLGLSLSLAAFVAVWVEGCQQQQVWAVQSFVTPLRGRNIFYWCCPLLSLFVSHCLRPFGFCPLHNCCPCSQLLLFFLKSPFGQVSRSVQFSKMLSYILVATFQ